MSFGVNNAPTVVGLVKCTQESPEKTLCPLPTESEPDKLRIGPCAMLDLQMPSFIRGDEEEDARELF